MAHWQVVVDGGRLSTMVGLPEVYGCSDNVWECDIASGFSGSKQLPEQSGGWFQKKPVLSPAAAVSRSPGEAGVSPAADTFG